MTLLCFKNADSVNIVKYNNRNNDIVKNINRNN